MGPNIFNVAMQMLQMRPDICNNPNAQSMIGAIQAGDNQRGVQIANNLCQSMGISPEQAYQQAKQFFKIP